MPIAARLKWYLDVNRVDYEVLGADVPECHGPPVSREQLVVSRLFHDVRGLVMVVHRASDRIAIPELEKFIGHPVKPAKASELREVFFDCEGGLLPPLGQAYGVPTIVDDRVPNDQDVYFSGGGRDDLVHMAGEEFSGLIADARQAHVAVA